ncbi:uncharacterized protein LOC123708402 [Pieris brassicae]|uniref:Uncharacterized protein n=1 Tax=Pieris brassicae TaxID=7116 RepID=A0A9P0SFU3_PIEBR|nr:uncharacterized protein LOC123708402 [Pieris brassicae]CAH3827135.1 unnamed protein product [Pieris brassicae]
MADDFIPLNQSTPVQDRWNGRNHNGYNKTVHQQNNNYRRNSNQKWMNNSHRSISFGSESNSSYTRDTKISIDAYLHPSMLQDPWAHLRRNN